MDDLWLELLERQATQIQSAIDALILSYRRGYGAVPEQLVLDSLVSVYHSLLRASSPASFTAHVTGLRGPSTDV